MKSKFFVLLLSGLIAGTILGYVVVLKYKTKKNINIPTEYSKEEIIIGDNVVDKNYYLAEPNDFVIDEEHNFYIVDSRTNCIMKYDSNYIFQKRIGRTGQGPGELIGPGNIYYVNKKLYVLDTRNLRLVIFSADGEYINSFNTSQTLEYTQLAVSSDGERIYINEPTPTRKSIFTMYDINGNILKRFGKMLIPKKFKDVMDVNEVAFDLDEENNLYVFYCWRPVVEKYDKDGNLLYQGKLLNLEVDERNLRNKDKPDYCKCIYINDVTYFQNKLYVVTPLVESLYVQHNIGFIMYTYDLNFSPLQRTLAKQTPNIDGYSDAIALSNVNGSAMIFGINKTACVLSKYN